MDHGAGRVTPPLRIGLVGYGTGGRHFHAPFIEAAQGVILAGVVARAPLTIERVRADLPDIPVHASLTEMLNAGVDAVTITTPPQTRRALVLEAVEGGVHVIADKPFAPSAAAAIELAEAARARGVTLGVFHNRRWDTDAQTLKKVLDGGALGRLWRMHSRMDLDDPATLEPGPTGGLLRDIGSHLVDQALWLLGPAVSVHGHLDMANFARGRTDVGFTLTIRHESGACSQLSSSKTNRLAAKEFLIYGENGSYVSSQSDVQAQAIFSGKRPAGNLEGWGFEDRSRWGTLRTAAGEQQVPSEQGCYHAYYENFARAVRTGSRPPVTAEDAIAVLEVLDAARLSAEEGREVRLDDRRQ